jgi:hypothetical protein
MLLGQHGNEFNKAVKKDILAILTCQDLSDVLDCELQFGCQVFIVEYVIVVRRSGVDLIAIVVTCLVLNAIQCLQNTIERGCVQPHQ